MDYNIHKKRNFVILVTSISIVLSFHVPVIRVTPQCSSTDSNDPSTITTLVDLERHHSFAICAGGRRVNFTEDLGSHWLHVYFPSERRVDGICYFNKRATSRSYNVEVYIGLGDNPGVLMPQHVYRITCVYGRSSAATSDVTQVTDRISPGDDLYYNYGGSSNSIVSLEVVDEWGKPLPENVRLGTVIRLKATLVIGQSGETSFQVLGCRAYGLSGSFPILEAGCGDGQAIPYNQGFTTHGPIALSHPFESFRLRGDAVVYYQCRFTMCSHVCDGPSCSHRQKRNSNDKIDTWFAAFHQTTQSTIIDDITTADNTQNNDIIREDTSTKNGKSRKRVDLDKIIRQEDRKSRFNEAIVALKDNESENVTEVDHITIPSKHTSSDDTKKLDDNTIFPNSTSNPMNVTYDVTAEPPGHYTTSHDTTKPAGNFTTSDDTTKHGENYMIFENSTKLTNHATFHDTTKSPRNNTPDVTPKPAENSSNVTNGLNYTTTDDTTEPALNYTISSNVTESLNYTTTDDTTKPQNYTTYNTTQTNATTAYNSRRRPAGVTQIYGFLTTKDPLSPHTEPGYNSHYYVTIVVIGVVCLAVAVFIVAMARYYRSSQRRYMEILN